MIKKHALYDDLANSELLMTLDSIIQKKPPIDEVPSITIPESPVREAPMAMPTFADCVQHKCRFTPHGKSKSPYSLDNSAIAPKPAVLVTRDFSKAYLNQLSGMLYSEGKEIDKPLLFEMTRLWFAGTDTGIPILLKSAKHRRNLPLICKTLNEFYDTHHATLAQIAVMIHDQIRPNVKEVKPHETSPSSTT